MKQVALYYFVACQFFSAACSHIIFSFKISTNQEYTEICLFEYLINMNNVIG